MSDTINSLCLLLSPSLFRCFFVASLCLKGQRREWHLSTWTLRLLLFLSLLPSAFLTWDKVTFTKGQYVSVGAPALFGERALKGVVERQRVVKRNSRGWQSWKVGLRTTATIGGGRKGRERRKGGLNKGKRKNTEDEDNEKNECGHERWTSFY